MLDEDGNYTPLKDWMRANRITRAKEKIDPRYVGGDPIVKLYSGRKLIFTGEVDWIEWHNITQR
jgi:hypothetical protein